MKWKIHKRDKCLSDGTDYRFWWPTKCGHSGGRGTTAREWNKVTCKRCLARKPKTAK